MKNLELLLTKAIEAIESVQLKQLADCKQPEPYEQSIGLLNSFDNLVVPGVHNPLPVLLRSTINILITDIGSVHWVVIFGLLEVSPFCVVKILLSLWLEVVLLCSRIFISSLVKVDSLVQLVFKVVGLS